MGNMLGSQRATFNESLNIQFAHERRLHDWWKIMARNNTEISKMDINVYQLKVSRSKY